MNNLLRVAREAVRTVPEVVQYLSAETKDALKSYDYFLSNIEGLVRGLYSGNVGGEFIDTFANLISGQLLDAYEKAWFDEGFTEALPDYLQESYQAAVSNQYGFVDQFYRDIVDAQIDKTSIEPLMVRAQLWANQWKASYNEAVRLIALENGARLRWNLGEAEHCNTCLALDGIVAFAKEWDAIGIKPQSDRLECHGFNCKCSFVQTDKRRSRDAYGRIEAAIYETKAMKGGEGSGNFGHAGRPGEVGGSAADGDGGSGMENIKDFESQISKNEKEVAGVFTSDGNLIFSTTDNKKGSVTFTDEQYSQLQGTIITHNHPLGITSLAAQDVNLMLNSGAIEIRAVGSSYTTSMTNLSGIRINIPDLEEQYKKLYKQESNRIKKGRGDIFFGASDFAWRSIADKYGLRYSRVKN